MSLNYILILLGKPNFSYLLWYFLVLYINLTLYTKSLF